eukprot:scaffold171718_cov37-Tisochrysis_lutea.AAC.1
MGIDGPTQQRSAAALPLPAATSNQRILADAVRCCYVVDRCALRRQAAPCAQRVKRADRVAPWRVARGAWYRI